MGIAHSSEVRQARKHTCAFCDIIHVDTNRVKLYEDDRVVAFNDISPQAAKHILVCPKEHIPTVEEVTEGDAELLAHMQAVGERLLGTPTTGPNHLGFHIPPFNSIYHLHLHCLQEPWGNRNAAYRYSDWGFGFTWWRPIADFRTNLKRQPKMAELQGEAMEKVIGNMGPLAGPMGEEAGPQPGAGKEEEKGPSQA